MTHLRSAVPLMVVGLFLSPVAGPSGALHAQVPTEGEVRQLVTFSFLPGRSGEAIELYRTGAHPLYQRNEPMLSFRAFREVESPIPLDLVVVSAFRGMSGMDDSNARLRDLATTAGTSVGALYGQIGALSSSHTDNFVEMIPALGAGDPSAHRLTAFIWYRVRPSDHATFESALTRLRPAEARLGIDASTGRFLISDDWSYLRLIGFDDLAGFQQYWSELRGSDALNALNEVTLGTREVVLASVPGLSVR